MKLLLAPLSISHTELNEFLVSDINGKECMIHRCPNCPENTAMLESKLNPLTAFNGYFCRIDLAIICVRQIYPLLSNNLKTRCLCLLLKSIVHIT